MRQALIQGDALGLPVISHCEDLSIINGGIVNRGVASETLGVRGMDRASEDYITAREIILAGFCQCADSYRSRQHLRQRGDHSSRQSTGCQGDL